MTDRSPGRRPAPIVHVLLSCCALVLLASCSGGSADSLVPPTPSAPPVFEIDRDAARPGDIVRIRATGIDSDPANLQVEFLSFSGQVRMNAPILEVTADGTQMGHGTIWSVRFRVPGSARSGSISLFSDGLPFGAFGFDVGPEVIGAQVGMGGALGAVTIDPTNTIVPGSVFLYGYNLTGVTEVQVVTDGGTFISNAVGLVPAAPRPPGTDMIEVDLPAGILLTSADTESLRLTCRSYLTPVSFLASAPVDIPIASIPLGGLLSEAEIPGFFTGVRVPGGVRSGDIPIDYSLLMDPAAAQFELVAEYQDPADATGANWIPCTPAPSSPTGDRLPGDRSVSPGGQLIGLGAGHRFVWDSEADLVGISDAIAVRVRLSLDNPMPSTAVCCPTGQWVSPRIVVDPGASPGGSIIEDFTSSTYRDPAGGNALWAGGELITPLGGGNPLPAWGNGTEDIVLVDGGIYEFDTTARTLTDITGAPVPLLTTNPGASLGEFHVATLTVEPAATVQVVGDFPLVIRCAGDGTDTILALDLRGDIILDGAIGGAGTDTDPGAGGTAGPGGGDGGDGARIEVDGGGADVLSIDDATDGASGGGRRGESTVLVLPLTVTNSLPRAGSGGGGAGATVGGDGVNTFDATVFPIADSGRGAPPRGDDTLTLEVGGSGGGGGGSCPIRVGFSGLVEKHGGGGGGGGGALEIAVRGRAELRGLLRAGGGDGAPGSSGTQSGAGGGGGGGSVAVRATGTLQLFDTARIEVPGGSGGVTVPGSQKGGDGSDGRIRLESDGGIILPMPLPPGLTVGTLTSGEFDRAGRLESTARSFAYPRVSSDGWTVGSPTTYEPATITPGAGAPPTGTHVIALYEGAASHPADPTVAGPFSGLVGDPALLGDAEFVRVRWFLYSEPGTRAVVDVWELPFTNP